LGVLIFAFSLSPNHVSAQAPSISYSPSTSALLVGVPFSVAPINSGGAVPATVYGTVTTFAGSTAGSSGRANGTGTAATFNLPRGTSIDAAGIQYVCDAGNNEIRKITQAGVVTLLAGSATGAAGRANGTGTAATFDLPYDATADGAGNLYVCDYNNNQIRKVVISTGVVTLLAGSATGASGTTNGTGTAALFNGPTGIVYNPADGFLYVADFNNSQIRKVSTAGVVTLLAGSTTGATGTTNNTGTAARFNNPNGIAVDASGNMYVCDQTNNEIRKVTTAGVVTLFAGSTTGATGTTDASGTAARFNTPRGVTIDPSGNLYITDSGNNTLRLISPAGLVTTFAGTAGSAGYTDAVGTAAKFDQPRGLDCDPATGNLYIADYTNNVIRQVITTGYLISASLPAGLSFDNTTGIISGTPTAAFGSTTYTIYAFNTTGSSSTTVTLSCTSPTVTIWRGTTNSTWTTTTNWSNGVPTSGNGRVAEIGTSAYTGVKAQPTISASTTIKALVFGTNNAATLTINSGITLTVSSGMGVQPSADVTVNGPGTLSLAGGSSVSATGSLTVASNAIISLAASSQLVNNGFLELVSNATGCASIAAVPSTSSLSGSFTVDRYITGGTITYRGYRLFSSPVNSGSGDYSISYLKNSIYITSTITTGGFDNVSAANPTIYLYRENLINPSNASFTGSNFRGVNDITGDPTFGMDDATYPTTNIPVGNGLLCFFRGNRSSTTFTNETKTNYVPQTVTLSATGSVNYGNITVSDWFTPGSTNLSYTSASPYAGYNLVGNPYPSSIDWDTFQTTSLATGGIYATSTVSKTMYVLDPVSHNFGAYISGHGGAGGTNNATNIIVSGQGFFVVATGTSPAQPQLTFTETAKVSTQNTGTNLLMGTPVAAAADQYLKLRFAKDTANADETVLRFNSQANVNYNINLDAPYKQGYGVVSLAGLSQDNVKSAIHNMPLPKLQAELVKLSIGANADGAYTLSLKDLVSVPRLYDIWLIDRYKNDSLDMRQYTTYNFNIYKADPASYGSGRFMLSIRQNPAYAYRLISFAGNKVTGAVKQVQLNWNTANESNYTNFAVERSTDGGKTYSIIGSLSASDAGTYGLLDKTPVEGLNQYRLKQEDVNNTITYSNVVDIQYAYQRNSLMVNNLMIYPNPGLNNINLAIQNPTSDITSYSIRFMNSSGVVVKQFTSAQAVWQGSVSGLEAGTYVVQVLNGKNASLIGETKFVKM